MKKRIVVSPLFLILGIVLLLFAGWLIAQLLQPSWIKYARQSRKDYERRADSISKNVPEKFAPVVARLDKAGFPVHEPVALAVGDDYIRNFTRDRRTQRQAEPSLDSTEWIWVSLRDLSGYVNNIDPSNNDGVRIYFGKVSQHDGLTEDQWNKLRKYDGQTTCIFMATSRFNDTTHYDNIDERMAVNMPNDINELCPPPKPCTSKGAILGQYGSLEEALAVLADWRTRAEESLKKKK